MPLTFGANRCEIHSSSETSLDLTHTFLEVGSSFSDWGHGKSQDLAAFFQVFGLSPNITLWAFISHASQRQVEPWIPTQDDLPSKLLQRFVSKHNHRHKHTHTHTHKEIEREAHMHTHTHTQMTTANSQPKEKAQNYKNVLIFMLSLNDSGILLSCITTFNRLRCCLIECVLCFTEASQFLEIHVFIVPLSICATGFIFSALKATSHFLFYQVQCG